MVVAIRSMAEVVASGGDEISHACRISDCGSRRAQVLLVAEEDDPRVVVGSDEVGGAICRAVVDDDQLESLIGLPEHRLERRTQVLAGVVNGHDHAHQGVARHGDQLSTQARDARLSPWRIAHRIVIGEERLGDRLVEAGSSEQLRRGADRLDPPSCITTIRSQDLSVDNRWATISIVVVDLSSPIVRVRSRSDWTSSALVGSSSTSSCGRPSSARAIVTAGVDHLTGHRRGPARCRVPAGAARDRRARGLRRPLPGRGRWSIDRGRTGCSRSRSTRAAGAPAEPGRRAATSRRR